MKKTTNQESDHLPYVDLDEARLLQAFEDVKAGRTMSKEEFNEKIKQAIKEA